MTNYYQIIGWLRNSDMSSYDMNDKKFDWKGYRFIGLDSGYDKNPILANDYSITVKGTGLYQNQLDWLNSADNNVIPNKTVVFMHHPVFDDILPEFTRPVLFNSADFVNIAVDKNIKLVLTGHTHQTKAFTASGIRNNDYSQGFSSPLFVQTRADGYMLVDVHPNSIGASLDAVSEFTLKDVKFTGESSSTTRSLYVFSPVDLHVYDEFGRHTGINSTGQVEINIPDSYYFEGYQIGNISIPASIYLYNSTLRYDAKIVSNFSKENIVGNSSEFTLVVKDQIGSTVTTTTYNNVSINRSSQARIVESNYTMQVDMNNDSVMDTVKVPDSIKTNNAPVAIIISPSTNATFAKGQAISFNGTVIDEDTNLTGTWISNINDVIGTGNVTTTNLSVGVHNISLRYADTSGLVNTAIIVMTIKDVISFTNPTPANGATLSQNYVLLNTTVSDFSTAFIDWNRSLIGWWRFNNENGENPSFFRDWSRENNASCSGTNCPASTSGKFGNALSFDGVNDYVDAGNGASLDVTGAITIESWINPAVAQEKCSDGVSGNYGVMSKVSAPINSANWSWQLRYGAPGNGCYLGFNFNGNPEDSRWVTIKQNLTPGQWYYIVGTFDGTDIKSYLDGNLKDTNKISAIRGYRNRFLIGNDGDGWGNYFNGKIDEVRIHKRALSPEEIKASYDAGIYRLYRNFTDLADGVYNYQAFSQNLAGAVNQTGTRTLNLIATSSPTVTPTQSAGTVTRSFSSPTVAPDATITITLTPSPNNLFSSPGYQVIETMPAGFTYLNTTVVGSIQGNVITLTQLGSSPITYILKAPSHNGFYNISGTFKDQISNIGIVSGTTNIGVGAGYDANSDGRIDRYEAIQAVIDYFSGNITRQDAINVVMAYFNG